MIGLVVKAASQAMARLMSAGGMAIPQGGPDFQPAFFAFTQLCLIKQQPALHSRYMNSLNPTSLRLAPADKRLLTRAARRRGMSLQKYLVDAGKKAARAPVSNLGQELEKLAIDGMAQLALVRIRARQSNRWTDEQIATEVKAARQ
jgi:hypothetical protein